MSDNLHICVLDKFISPCFSFIKDEFPAEEHQFYIFGDAEKYSYESDSQTFQYGSSRGGWLLLKLMYSADKIILHSLFNSLILLIITCNPYLLKKVLLGNMGAIFFYVY